MKQQILIVGGGFAGVWSALSAMRLLDQHGRTDIAVTLLAPQPELRVRPRFYEPDVQSMKAPLLELFAAVGIHYVQGSAQAIDPQGQRVDYRDAAGAEGTLSYDRLVLASGSAAAQDPSFRLVNGGSVRPATVPPRGPVAPLPKFQAMPSGEVARPIA